MSWLRKSFLGPALSSPCSHCGKRVSVPWLAVGAVVPFVVGIRLAVYLGYSWQAALVVLAGVGAMFAVHAFLVPLVPRGS